MGLLSAAAKAELQKGTVHLAVLVELEFATGVERYWSGLQALSHEGEYWLPTGDFGGIDPIESTEDFRANGIKLTLNGLPGDSEKPVRYVSAGSYKARRARFIVVIMDSTFTNVIHAMPRHYFMDVLDYEYDPAGTVSVSLALETEVRYGSRSSIKRFSDQEQKSRFPGDRAFEFVNYLNSGVEVKWGTSGTYFK